MMNSCVLVGTVTEPVQLNTSSKGTTYGTMFVSTDRPFRNDDGSVTADIFRVTLWRGIADETAASCSVGSLVAVKGRLQSNNYEKDGRTYYNAEVIAEKVSYLHNLGDEPAF